MEPSRDEIAVPTKASGSPEMMIDRDDARAIVKGRLADLRKQLEELVEHIDGCMDHPNVSDRAGRIQTALPRVVRDGKRCVEGLAAYREILRQR